MIDEIRVDEALGVAFLAAEDIDFAFHQFPTQLGALGRIDRSVNRHCLAFFAFGTFQRNLPGRGHSTLLDDCQPGSAAIDNTRREFGRTTFRSVQPRTGGGNTGCAGRPDQPEPSVKRRP
jgi:hypothetical protein